MNGDKIFVAALSIKRSGKYNIKNVAAISLSDSDKICLFVPYG